MAASAFSLRCSVKAQVNLAFDLLSSYTEAWVSNPGYQNNKKPKASSGIFYWLALVLEVRKLKDSLIF